MLMCFNLCSKILRDKEDCRLLQLPHTGYTCMSERVPVKCHIAQFFQLHWWQTLEFLVCLSWCEERICLYRSQMSKSSGLFGKKRLCSFSLHTPERAGFFPLFVSSFLFFFGWLGFCLVCLGGGVFWFFEVFCGFFGLFGVCFILFFKAKWNASNSENKVHPPKQSSGRGAEIRE